MNIEAAKKIADAVLYEGYMLYPYRPSAIKNQQRWSFGILYPPAYREVAANTEQAGMHSECLVEVHGNAPISLQLQLRFLHLMRLQTLQEHDGQLRPVSSLTVGDQRVESREDGLERTVECAWSPGASFERTFEFPGSSTEEERLTRTQAAICGRIAITSDRLSKGLLKLTIDVENTTPAAADIEREAALLCSLVSAHTILSVKGGEFISLLDPPPEVQSAANACRNIGNFPVLVGEKGERNMLLCSPIILYDYPQIAPESAGDFFDGTEMDEMLTLRVLTLTADEKNEMRLSDPRAGELLRRTEQSAREQLMRTHGTIRNFSPSGEHDAG